MRHLLNSFRIAACFAWCVFPTLLLSDEPIRFRSQIQPILAKHCFACHGPDADQRQADLRLDDRESATSHVIAPGAPDSSEFIARIMSEDESLVMPPSETNQKLSDTEKSLLARWIAEGAKYESHWAFEPITNPAVPPVENDWAVNPIDQFVFARLQEAGLSPSPPAASHQLLRRLHFDLIGLPPDEKNAEEFLNDPTSANYSRLVETLLQSPHYGEHAAASWLDLARYADTNGYQNDFYRSQWPWRDWVIASFNRHQRFDQFLIEQIAGDLLPDPSRDQLVATGFNRNNRSVTEGGSIEEEWQVENAVDRVETTAATFLGLTMGCARCHDHKYDPIDRDDFYQFYAFFNNIDEKGVYIETRGNTGPQVSVPTEAQLRELGEIEQRIAAVKEKLDANVPMVTANEVLAQWRTETENFASEFPTPLYRTEPQATQPSDEPESAPASPVGPAIHFTGETKPESHLNGEHWETVERDTPFTWSVWVNGAARGTLFSKMNEPENHRGFDGILLPDGKIKIHLIHHWNQNAIAVISKQPLPDQQWSMLAVSYDGSSKASGLKIYLNGRPVDVDIEVDSLTETIRTDRPAYLGQRSQSLHLNGFIVDFCWFDQVLSPEQIEFWLRSTVVHAAQNLDTESKPRDSVVRYIDALSTGELRSELRSVEAERERSLANQQTCMIMKDRPGYRPTYVLQRGLYDHADTSRELWPAVPSMLPPMSDDDPKNRLGLANWMVDSRNPLVARVAVNRIWSQFFGTGLVETHDNFGIQGDYPSHPELLDWLASEFRDSGWDVQHIQRLIVTSQTYRQSSEQDPELRANDPDNRMLSRGPRYRLTGEQLRDQALSVSGLLTTRVGGPGVFPYQPAGLWEELAGGANDGPYQHSNGPDLYRRGLYTYRKRTVSHPTLSTFDAPSWEICYVKRATTNTPLQSLALLNGPTYVEAARKLAELVLTRHDEFGSEDSPTADEDASQFDQVLVTLFRCTLFREPTTPERQRLKESFVQWHEYYQQNPAEASSLLAVGESTSERDWNPTVHAALTIVASVVMNLDEFLTRE